MPNNPEVENKKSDLEGQYQELFSPTIQKAKVQSIVFRQQHNSEEFVTWVTYGAFEKPII